MADEFDQYIRSSAQAPVQAPQDEFAQYARNTTPATASVSPEGPKPTGLSPLPGPIRAPGYRILASLGANPYALDKLESFAQYLPNSDEALAIGAPAEGVATGAVALGKRAIGVMSGLLTGYGIHAGTNKLGSMLGIPHAVSEVIGDTLGAVTGNFVAKNISPEAALTVENLLKTKGLGAVRAWLREAVTPAPEAEGGFRVNPAILKKTTIEEPPPPTNSTVKQYNTDALEEALFQEFKKRLRTTENEPFKMFGFGPQTAEASVTPAPIPKPPSPSTPSEPPPGHEAFLNQETTGLQIPQQQNARTAIATGLAKEFKKAGLNADHIDALKATNPAEYEKFKQNAGKIATQLGLSKQKVYATSDATMDRVLEIMRGGYKLPEIPKQ